MERFILTEELLENASSYAPLGVKEDFVNGVVDRCLSVVTVDLNIGENSAMPNLYAEDSFAKSRYLMAALLVLYLGIPKENLTMRGDDPWLLDEGEYDLFAGSHIVNQLERTKGNGAFRDKIFDLLRDYRDLEKKLNTAIYHRLEARNDPMNRMFQKLAMDTSEAALEAQKEAIEDLNRQLEELKRARDEQKE